MSFRRDMNTLFILQDVEPISKTGHLVLIWQSYNRNPETTLSKSLSVGSAPHLVHPLSWWSLGNTFPV